MTTAIARALANMKEFLVHALYSGTSPDDTWVTLRFASDCSADDVLHIVCSLDVDEQDSDLGMASIYLERDDQARGCYGGADRINVSPAGVDVVLNSLGQSRLQLPRTVRLCWPPRLRGKAAATRRLTHMAQHPYGRVVHVG